MQYQESCHVVSSLKLKIPGEDGEIQISTGYILLKINRSLSNSKKNISQGVMKQQKDTRKECQMVLKEINESHNLEINYMLKSSIP